MRPPTIKNIGQAVIELRNQQHHPTTTGAITHLPSMVKRFAISLKFAVVCRAQRWPWPAKHTRMKKARSQYRYIAERRDVLARSNKKVDTGRTTRDDPGKRESHDDDSTCGDRMMQTV